MRTVGRDSGADVAGTKPGKWEIGIMHPYELCWEVLALILIRTLLWLVSGTFPLISYASIVIASVPVCGSFRELPLFLFSIHRKTHLAMCESYSLPGLAPLASGDLGEVSSALPKLPSQGGALSFWWPGMQRWLWIMLSFWTVCTRMIR